MMRRALLAAIALSLLVAAPAEARTLPSLLSKQIKKINGAARAPDVLLPRSMPLDATHLWPSGGPAGSSYTLLIGAVRRCGDADACFVAEFSAQKANTVFGKPVKVKGASKAGYFPLSCGASCSPPQIDFIVNGVRYTIQANLKGSNNRKTLIDAAQSSISAGPR